MEAESELDPPWEADTENTSNENPKQNVSIFSGVCFYLYVTRIVYVCMSIVTWYGSEIILSDYPRKMTLSDGFSRIFFL